MRRTRRCCPGPTARKVAGGVLVLFCVSCAGPRHWSLSEPPRVPVDQSGIESTPAERDPSLYWDAINQSSFYLINQSLDLPRQYRKLFGKRREAYNADVLGEVPPSSWYQPRHAYKRMSAEELTRGSKTIAGPDMSGPWTITRAKTQGVTPGFFFKDASGETFILKFDPPAYPELGTGAEMVSTSFFYALGYNVPENYLVTFDPSILTIKENLEYKTKEGARVPFTRGVLDEVLGRVATRPDGTIRAVASRFLPGKPIGPFSYTGQRADDPNDRIPHQHRRELRGLRVFASLVNHFDTKDHNSLDILADDNGTRYVRHYLIDFGSTLGSDGDEPKPVDKGYAYAIDLEQAVVSLATLGLRKWSWEGASAEGMPEAVGYFESERFTPDGWKPLHANPAFDRMTHLDAYWATRIVAAFTPDDLKAIVAAAEYTDPAATKYLTKVLVERRRKIIEYYYGKVNPLGEFQIARTMDSFAIVFDDRWVADSVGSADGVVHRFRFGHRRGSSGSYRELQGPLEITPDAATIAWMDAIVRGATSPDDMVFGVQVQSRRRGHWGKWVKVYFYYDSSDNARIVGIERDS